MYLSETYEKKWQPVLEHPDLPKITDSYRRAVTATILENQERAQKEDAAFLYEAAPTNSTGSSVANWDPILISLVRRAMPNLIAYDIAGVQPMTGPTGLIFAMRSRYTSQTGAEAMFNEADTDFSSRNAAGDSTLPGVGGEDQHLHKREQILLYLTTHQLVLILLVLVCRLLLRKH
jgi:hypothetical protein